MRTGITQDVPARLERLRRRFDRWRETRNGRSRIPDALWVAAVKAAGRHGLNPTARALRLDYYSLKKRVEAFPREFPGRTAGTRGGSDGQPVVRPGPRLRGLASKRGSRPAAAFVEWSALVPACSPECIVELEDPRGAKMRVHLKGVQAPDWAALSRTFWRLPPRRGAKS